MHYVAAHFKNCNYFVAIISISDWVYAGHDRSIRLWDAGDKTMIDELTIHKNKSNEAVHVVKWHPTLPIFAR